MLFTKASATQFNCSSRTPFSTKSFLKPIYSSQGWKFNRRKLVKRTEESDLETDGLDDNEGLATEIDGDIEDDDDDNSDSGVGLKLNYEGSLGSTILGKDELLKGNWDGQDSALLYHTVPLVQLSTTAIPDSFNTQKPDLSLFNFTLLKEKKSWADVLAFMEHTSSDLSKNRGLAVSWGSAIKAYLITQEQPWN
ncbi:hypothetical protein C8R48DRAFT_767461 [Suillus tomentosus]|nr:hypothetical protein C8R48DRAFT_767461 [Suillus tomentosus]